VTATNGVLPAADLADETGTALNALADLAGPAVIWIGSAFVVLGLGIGCVHLSLALFFLVDERIPRMSEGGLLVRNRFLLCILPVGIAFLVSEWLSITGEGSFAGLLGFVGIMTLPLLAGVFPVLLLAATRRKGDLAPGFMLKWLGNPILLVGIYLLFVLSIFLHGLFAFQTVLEGGIILLVGCIVLVMTGVMIRQKALVRRLVVELRQNQTARGGDLFNLTANGQPAVSGVCLAYHDSQTRLTAATGQIANFGSLRSIRFHIPMAGASEMKVWAHKITPRWTSEQLPAQGTIELAGSRRELSFSHSDGQDSFPVEAESCDLEIRLKERD
jgi:hypothetical protein